MEASSELVECGHKSWLAGSMKKKKHKKQLFTIVGNIFTESNTFHLTHQLNAL